MNRRRFPLILMTVSALLLGLLLPFLTAAVQDFTLNRQTWPVSSENAHYAYQGTLMNRVTALNAYLNTSPSVIKTPDTEAGAPENLTAPLAAFLPFKDESFEKAVSFSLSPRQYSAEYQYIEAQYSLENGSLTVITDCETGLPLRVELSCPSEMLEVWLKDNALWDILHEYASLLNLGETADDDTSISTVLRSQSAKIRGTSFRITVTVIPSTGSLLLKLTAAAPA